jgi:hypothetical protein
MILLLTIMATIILQPVAEAVLNLSAKTPIGSVLRSAGWAQMPLDLRARGQFSAGVESARVVNRIQNGLVDILAANRDARGVFMDRSKLITEINRLAEQEGLAPVEPGAKGTIRDITSEARADLIYRTQTEMAYGFANWKAGQDPDALNAVPAQELIRVSPRRVPRDWQSRWIEAGGRPGRMVALKSDPIWRKISRFGTPWPPFDFNSGMGVEDILRPEAEKLGLLTPGQLPQPTIEDFNAKLEASVSDLTPELRQNLQSLFGPQVDIDSETVRWKSNLGPYERAQQQILVDAPSIASRSTDALVPVLADQTAGDAGIQISAVASGRKPLFAVSLGFGGQTEFTAAAEGVQATLPQGVVATVENGELIVYHPDLVGRLAEPGQGLMPQIIANRANGAWLGFGERLADSEMVTVAILEPNGNIALEFRTPAQYAELYAAARAKDYSDATGLRYTARIPA